MPFQTAPSSGPAATRPQDRQRSAPSRTPRRGPGALIALLAALLLCSGTTVTFAAYALRRYDSFNATAFDLGFFDQVVWQIARGHPGATSYVPYSFFGQHLEPVLYLFGALYRLWPDPRLLLLSQAIAVGLAGFLFFLAARHVLPPAAALAFVAALLFTVPLHAALAFDFHPEVISCLPLAAGILLALRGQARAAALCWLSLLLFKEDEALVLLALGPLLFAASHRLRPALFVSAAGMVWAALAVGVIEPHLRGGARGDLALQYAAFGLNLGQALRTLSLHPLSSAAIIFGSGGLAALLAWLAGTGFAPLLAPAGLLAAAPELLLQLASSHPQQHLLQLHYGVEAVPLVFAVLLVQLRRLRPRRQLLLSGVLLALTLVAFLRGSPLSPFRTWPTVTAQRRQALESAARLIPADAVLRADSTLAAHLSQRSEVYEFPGPDRGGWVAVDRRGFHSPQSLAAGFDGELKRLPDEGYARIFADEGVEVWRR